MTDDTAAPAATAARAILAGQIRHGLVALGTAAIAKGVASQGQVDAIVPSLVDYLTGALIIFGASAWSALRAWLTHHPDTRIAAAWAVLRGNDPFPQAPGDQK